MQFPLPLLHAARDLHDQYQFLKKAERLSFEEILASPAAAALGVSKLRLTGGEPLLVQASPSSWASFPRIGGRGPALTTNGSAAGTARASGLPSAACSV